MAEANLKKLPSKLPKFLHKYFWEARVEKVNPPRRFRLRYRTTTERVMFPKGIAPKTKRSLALLGQINNLKQFYLAERTAIALRLGHRIFFV